MLFFIGLRNVGEETRAASEGHVGLARRPVHHDSQAVPPTQPLFVRPAQPDPTGLSRTPSLINTEARAASAQYPLPQVPVL